MSDRPVTMKMVARAAGLHPSSVSLALRNHPSIPEATRRHPGPPPGPLPACLNTRPGPHLASRFSASPHFILIAKFEA